MSASVAQSVTVRICGMQYMHTQSAPDAIRTESVAQGTYYVRNGAHYLFWEERMEGVDASVQSRLKYRDGCLEVTRRGGMNSHMIFETGKTYCTDYATPVGILRMEIAADSVAMEEAADGTMCISTRYRLCQEGEPALCCEATVEIRGIRSEL